MVLLHHHQLQVIMNNLMLVHKLVPQHIQRLQMILIIMIRNQPQQRTSIKQTIHLHHIHLLGVKSQHLINLQQVAKMIRITLHHHNHHHRVSVKIPLRQETLIMFPMCMIFLQDLINHQAVMPLKMNHPLQPPLLDILHFLLVVI